MEIVGLASGHLVFALNLAQLALMVAAAAVAFSMARREKSFLGYVLALGILALSAHIAAEILMEVETLSVVALKTAAVLLFLIAVWFFATLEDERLKLLGYSEKLEKEVKARTKEWSTTFNAISDSVSVHDRDFKIVKVNKVFADFMGRKPE